MVLFTGGFFRAGVNKSCQCQKRSCGFQTADSLLPLGGQQPTSRSDQSDATLYAPAFFTGCPNLESLGVGGGGGCRRRLPDALEFRALDAGKDGEFRRDLGDEWRWSWRWRDDGSFFIVFFFCFLFLFFLEEQS